MTLLSPNLGLIVSLGLFLPVRPQLCKDMVWSHLLGIQQQHSTHHIEERNREKKKIQECWHTTLKDLRFGVNEFQERRNQNDRNSQNYVKYLSHEIMSQQGEGSMFKFQLQQINDFEVCIPILVLIKQPEHIDINEFFQLYPFKR